MRLIDGDALEREISVLHSMTDDYGIQTGYVICMRSIEDAPTIEPQRTGRWIDAQYPYSKCSICGEELDTLSYEANYCPNCGARMEGES